MTDNAVVFDFPSASSLSRSALVRRLLERPVPCPDHEVELELSEVDNGNGDGADDGDDDAVESPPFLNNASDGYRNHSTNRRENITTLSSSTTSTSTTAASPASLEALPPDASSYILSYLHPHDLFHFALTSKQCCGMFNCELLWKWKFRARWNCVPDPIHHVVHCDYSNDADDGAFNDESDSSSGSGSGGFWKKSYINAHRNPHDLWIRHWNCVFPEDVTTCAGRTVVPNVQFGENDGDWEACNQQRQQQSQSQSHLMGKSQRQRDVIDSDDGIGIDSTGNDHNIRRQKQKDFDSPSLSQCPTCRYHPMLHRSRNGYGNCDVVEAMEAEMNFAQSSTASSSSIPVHDNGGEDIKCDSDSSSSTSLSDPVDRARVVAAAHALLSNPTNEIASSAQLETTPARTIHYSTQYSIAKWCRNMHDDGGHDKENHRKSNHKPGQCQSQSQGVSLLERYHDSLQNNGVGKIIDTKEQQESVVVRNRAQFAFECASTHDRRIQTSQYQSSGMNFFTDALFFNIHPSYEKNRISSSSSSSSLRSRLSGGCASAASSKRNTVLHSSHSPMPTPMEELLRDVHGQPSPSPSIRSSPRESESSISQLGPNFETSHHTWHVIRLTNPDFTLPITFRAYMQSETFTIYPSQGYLRPGETTHLVLGVRMKGSLTNEVFEQFDIEKDDDDGNKTMGPTRGTAGTGTHHHHHLPLVPFAIRYMFAPPVACVPHDYTSRPENNTAGSIFAQLSDSVKLPSVVDQLWNNVSSEADVRTIFLSAHVHSNYGFEEFQHATLMPFDIISSLKNNNQDPCSSMMMPPLTTIMPNLQGKSPKLFSLLQNLDEELEDSVTGELCRTEKKCVFCKRDWGPQSELLGRAYILRKLECTKHGLIRAEQEADFERTLNMVPSLLRSSMLGNNTTEEFSIPRVNRICQLLFCLHTGYLLQKRAARLVTEKERRLYSAYERYIDETYSDLQKVLLPGSKVGNEEESKVWRQKGVVLKNARCDDGFIGRQDDPNHEAESDMGQHPTMHTDMFQNDPLKGFFAAVSMISNPEKLVGYGVFDRVKKPGAIVRCPSKPIDAFLCPSESELDQQKLVRRAVNLLQKSALDPSLTSSQSRQHLRHWSYFKKINYEVNDQDPDGLGLITLGHGMDINFQTSMAHFLSNVPLPGVGPLLFSSPKGTTDDDDYNPSIDLLYTKVQPYSHILFPARICDNLGNEKQNAEPNQPSSNAQNQQNQRHGDGQGVNLELNIVWLIARHLGWVVDDDDNRGSLLIDRRLLIATQWLNNTIMAFSLLASLLSRKFQLITSKPVSVQGIRFGFWQDVYMNMPFRGSLHHLIDSNQMRFWSKDVCGIAAIIVFAFYFVLGRSVERHIGRSYEHELTDASPKLKLERKHIGRLDKISWYFSDKMQWLWDCTCPLFLQQRLCLSRRSGKTHTQVMNEVIHMRSKNSREISSNTLFNASQGRGRMNVEVSNRKIGAFGHFVGLAFFFLSFSACSPHFVINSLTVFSCGLSYGMSLSLESMEIVRRPTSTGVLSMIKPRRLNTHVIGVITIGQLVGSSGGVFFLAEFIVTAISLLLGGAATVTSSTLESWITFFCLSSTAFWAFVFARLGLLDGMRKKRRGVPSALLCASLCSAISMWAMVLTSVDWLAVSPGSLIVAEMQDLFTDIRRRRNFN